VHTVSTSFLPISYNNRIFAALMNKMKAKLLLIVSFFLLLSQTLVAQEQDTVQRKKTRINILHYDKATYSKSMGDVQRLIGNVKMRHDSAYFFCDSAYYYQKNNSFDAYQNVHIIVNDSVEIFSDLLNYDGDRRFAEFHDNVRLRDDSTMLYTEYLTYDRNLHLASYPDSATTVRGDKTLKSHYGYYRDRLKEFSFFENVEVYSPKYQMYTDTLFYNTDIEKMWFEGPTTIINKENVLEGKHGYYLVNEDFVYLDKRPYMHNETQQMRADSIFYDRNKGLAQAYNQVDMIDTSYQVIMRGDYVEMWENKGFSFATDSAYAISYDGGDSLYIHGDTLFMYFDKEKEEAEKLIARRNVRFFKSDMQGKCDTLTYLKADSIIQMRVAPILWAEDSQLTGVDIDIKLKDHNVDWVLQKGNAFIISKDSIEGYNQIKGKDITSRFKNGDIHRVNVDGDKAETIYWIRDDDGGTIGIDVSKSETMVIEMEKQSVSIIKSFKDIDETMYPEKDLSESNRYLSGFKWHEEARPKDKDDIFRRIEAEMPKVEVTPVEKPEENTTETKTEEEQPKRHRAKKEINNN
jgi:lipopolysaccharide export system protein LptA